jgi:hypothetical protein
MAWGTPLSDHIFWNFIFQPLVLEFILVSLHTHSGSFENFEKNLEKFTKMEKKIWPELF